MKLYQLAYSPYAAKVRKYLELKQLARELPALAAWYANVR